MLMKRSSIDFGILDFFINFCNTVYEPMECNLDVISQPQKVCIARFNCVSSSLSNCLDFLISTAVLLELEYNCMGWWSDWLKCQRRIRRLVSSPKSVTRQAFVTVMALDTISTSASPSECITLIPEADNWVPSISRKACLLRLCRKKSSFFFHSQWIMEGCYNFSS